ncbi:C-terminal domain of CHU protein family protein [Hymenobacter arizonensis]|uniref:C-terminal domain of CHU protein family protein n=2 Tax=Hymenobacter arizonensis TaxID=1227077 RepID=A0A1I5Z9P8_HYMAR|nr:C-terminal domain of CHU protein family protein [Hymenobacter arizonensis]
MAKVTLLVVLLLAGLGLRPEGAWATHIRAGDIQAKSDTTLPIANRNPRRVFFKMVLYTTMTGFDEETVTIFFGDGSSSCEGGIARIPGGRRPIPGAPDTGLNIYLFEHTFPSSGSFTITYTGENRVGGVLNMDNSIAQSFHISTTITLDPALLGNSSPVLRAPAVDKAAVSQVFLHNPAGFDADGDSLAYKLRPSQKVSRAVGVIVGSPCSGATGDNTPVAQQVPNFVYPNSASISPGAVQVEYAGNPVGVRDNPAIFVQDVRTGQITWNAPIRVGFYNVAMVVEEWRRTPLGRRKIGEVIRDIQIIVSATSNLRPTITIPADICVIAGQTVTGQVSAVDGLSATSPQTPISLFAYSGIIPPATFTQTATGPPTAQGTFTWRTECSNVAQQPYLVVFKAQDTPSGGNLATNPPLIDEKPWRITVIGPPPQSLRVTPALTGLNSAGLTWSPYVCTNASVIHIYRKENTAGWTPGDCETGIPASTGYVRIATVPASATSFTDNNVSAGGTNQGFERGKTYCYRIYAEFPFPAGGASIASEEACVTFDGRAAQLKNVDVEETSATAGRIAVRWTQPRAAAGQVLQGTPSYVLSRGEGLAPATYAVVRTFTAITDTFFIDTNLNTQDLQYTYKLEFVRTLANTQVPQVIRETATPASSVRVSVVPTSSTSGFSLTWTYQVPWTNTAKPVVIYRRNSAPGSPYVQIATAPTGLAGGSYRDEDAALVKGQTYCYYVRTEGQYAPTGYLSSLLNRSQEQCAKLIAPPCVPVLSLAVTNCDSLAALPSFPRPNERYTNRLRWRLGNVPAGCDEDVASYRVYYRPGPTGAFALLGTTTQTSYLHPNLEFNGGCYAVQAVAPGGVRSDTSNVACQDNCVFFLLPNIFTPNGDAQNPVFRPKNHSPVRQVRFQAFNRWGVKVFENVTTAADPVLINWDGGPAGESSNGRLLKVSDGIYYYLAEVEFADFANTKRTYKGWVEVRR